VLSLLDRTHTSYPYISSLNLLRTPKIELLDRSLNSASLLMNSKVSEISQQRVALVLENETSR
jgi:hypothetical protein